MEIAGCGEHGPGQESSAPERLIEWKKTMGAKGAGEGEKRARSGRAGRGEDCWGTRFLAKVRARGAWVGREMRRRCEIDAEEAEVGREEAGRVPPCRDELGGEVSNEVRRG